MTKLANFGGLTDPIESLCRDHNDNCGIICMICVNV